MADDDYVYPVSILTDEETMAGRVRTRVLFGYTHRALVFDLVSPQAQKRAPARKPVTAAVPIMAEAMLYKCPMCPHTVKTQRGLARHVKYHHTPVATAAAAPVANIVEFITPESLELGRIKARHRQLCAAVIANRETLDRVRPDSKMEPSTPTPAALLGGIQQCTNVLDKAVENVRVAENKEKVAVDACKVASELMGKAQHDMCVDPANDQLNAHANAMREAWKQATETVRTASDAHKKLVHVRNEASRALKRAQDARDTYAATQERKADYAQACEAHTRLIRERNQALVDYKKMREGLRTSYEARKQYIHTQGEEHFEVADDAVVDDSVY